MKVRFATVVVFVIGSVLSLSVYEGARAATITTHTSPVRSVWTQPAAGYGFLRTAFSDAKQSIDLSIYELEDPTMEAKLVARARAGVDVRVLLNAAYDGTAHNTPAANILRAGGVHVEWAPAGQIFHAKYAVIDGRLLYVGTGNLVVTDYPTTRDFWLLDANRTDVTAARATFDDDFSGSGAGTRTAGGLVWSPGSAARIVSLIGAARHTLLIENEEMDSTAIENAITDAARRGVSVDVVMTYESSWRTALARLASAGVHVSQLNSSQVYIHAKVACADCSASGGVVFIGSENFSTSSLNYNRELGVVTTTRAAIDAVRSAVLSDFSAGLKLATGPRAPTTTIASTGGALSITSFAATIAPGDEDSLSIHSAQPNETCSLSVTLPSGATSESEGLGAARTDAAGDVTWIWKIGTSTGAGTAKATISCTTGTLQRSFAIT
jgi:hypothetical protein